MRVTVKYSIVKQLIAMNAHQGINDAGRIGGKCGLLILERLTNPAGRAIVGGNPRIDQRILGS